MEVGEACFDHGILGAQLGEHVGRNVAGDDVDSARGQMDGVEAGSGSDIEDERAGWKKSVESIPESAAHPLRGVELRVVEGGEEIVGGSHPHPRLLPRARITRRGGGESEAGGFGALVGEDTMEGAEFEWESIETQVVAPRGGGAEQRSPRAV